MIQDQASKLRRRAQEINRFNLKSPERGARRIAVTSGKGGVGKSNVSLNLGICFGKLRKSALLVDADVNLANIDILLGIHPKKTLLDAVLRDAFIPDILLDGPEGLRILPAGSGSIEIMGLEKVVRERLFNGLADLEKRHDVIILDTGAGISDGVLEYASGSDEAIIITTPEPTAITDAYAAIKMISSRNPAVKLYLLVNMVRSRQEAEEVARNIRLVVENYLTVTIEPLGFLPTDAHIARAVAAQTPFLTAFPRCQASLNLMMIARKLLKLPATGSASGGSLFSNLFKSARGGLLES
jgi:flagellar biosynthesis protein FlhG